MPNTVFCVCVVCQVPNTCETYEKIDGRMYCPACAAKQRG